MGQTLIHLWPLAKLFVLCLASLKQGKVTTNKLQQGPFEYSTVHSLVEAWHGRRPLAVMPVQRVTLDR